MGALSSILEIGKAIAEWRNPTRVERATLLGAIESAKEIIKILKKQGRYKFFSEDKLREHEIHYQKRLDAWSDGQP